MTRSSADAFAFERDVNVADVFTYLGNVRIESKRGRTSSSSTLQITVILHEMPVYSRHRRKQTVTIG